MTFSIRTLSILTEYRFHAQYCDYLNDTECCYADSDYAECRFDECCYAECCGAKFFNQEVKIKITNLLVVSVILKIISMYS
jgi:hypothetical protein